MNHSTVQRFTITAAKALVSAGLIAFLLRGIDSNAVIDHLRAVNGPAVILAAIVTMATSLLHALRWKMILARMGHGLRYAEALRLVLIGNFFNLPLPSTVGGDAFRAWGAYRIGIRASDSITSVVVDRICALAALVLMIVMGLWWLFDLIRGPAARWMISVAVGCFVTGIIMLLSLARFGQNLRRWRVTRWLLHVSEGLGAVVSKPKVTIQVVALALAAHVTLSYAVHILARGLSIDLALEHSLLLVPLVTLVTVLPVSISGWGLRESAMVVALGLIAVPPVQALSLSILYGLVVMACGVPGGFIWLLALRHAPAEGPVSTARRTR